MTASVFFDDEYSKEKRDEMREWCHEHCSNRFRPGDSSSIGFLGDQMEFYERHQVPWRFSNQEDATLFKLRWLPR